MSLTATMTFAADTAPLDPNAPLGLDTGAPAFSLDPALKRALLSRMQTLGEGEYPPREGLYNLRRAIAWFHRTRLGIPDEAENIQITYGGMQALTDVLDAVLEPGDEVLLPAPYWYHFPRLIERAGGAAKIVRTEAAHDYKLTAKSLREQIGPKTRLLILTNPNNPTGSVHNRQEMQALVDVLVDNPHVQIIADEVYNQLVFGVNGLSASAPSLAAWPEIRPRVYTINSFSKNFGLSGLRVGYISADASLLPQLTEAQRFSTLGVNACLQELALAVLLSQPVIVPDLMGRLRRRRDRAMDHMQRIPGLTVTIPQAGYYFWADMAYWLGSKTPNGSVINCDVDLARWLKQSAGVALQTGSECGAKGFLRFTFAIPEQDFAEGARRVAHGLRQLRF